jgi:hypothetical protein
VQDEHRWIRERFLGYALGTLEDASRSRSETHLASCADCREQYGEFCGELGMKTATHGHLPAAMIARWDRAHRELSGLERDAVRLHLQHCASCQEDMKLVGQNASSTSSALPNFSRQRRAATWVPWLGGGAMGALATAALLLWLVDPSRTAPREPSRPDGATRVVAPATPELLAMPWISPATLRGEAVSLELPASTSELALALAVASVADGSATLLRVHGPDAAIVATTTIQSDAVRAGTAIVVLRDPGGWKAGSYRVVLWEAGSIPEADSTESYFELRTRP